MLDQIVIIVGVTALILISPGPDMAIVMRNTFVGGCSAGYQTSLGVLSGNLVHITYCVVGIGWLISKSIIAFSILKYAGAAYLIYLGVTSLRANHTSVEPENKNEKKIYRSWFMQGFVNNVLNPKGTLFFLGVFTTVITPETSIFATSLLVSIIVGMCAVFWFFFVRTLDSAQFKRFIERSQHIVNRVFGVVLISLGIRVAALSR